MHSKKINLFSFGFTKAVFIIIIFLSSVQVFSIVDEKQNILLIHSYHRGYIWSDKVNEGILNHFQERDIPVEFYIEYMDTLRMNNVVLELAYNQYIEEKYKGRDIDLIISVDQEAFNFIKDVRNDVFGDIPFIFCGIQEFQPEMLNGLKNATGVSKNVDVIGTIELMFELNSNIEEIFIISDNSPFSKQVLERIDEIKENLFTEVEFNNLRDKSLKEIVDYISEADKNSAGLYVSYYFNPEGIYYQSEEIINMLSQVKRAPVFGLLDYYIEQGLVGGKVACGEIHGSKVAEIAIEIIGGKSPDDIPVVYDLPYSKVFNYDVLQELNLSVGTVPSDSDILGEPDNFFYLYRKRIIATLLFLFLQTVIIVYLFINIKKRKKAEKEIKKFNVTLEDRIKERTLQLEIINNELESFVYAVSHDLRSPLGLIIGYGNMLLEEMKKREDEKGVKFLNNIVKAAERMNELTRDLMKLAQLNQQQIEFEEFNLSEVVFEILDNLKRHEPDRNIKIKVQKNLFVKADKSLMKTVMENLLQNAYKYTGEEEEAEIEFGESLWKNVSGENEKVFYVKDNGVGFDMKNCDKIFEVFTRLKNSKKFKGTGIGLATVKRIIDRHNGKIWVEAKENIGCIFYFKI
ncbi:MAG: ABC transporter substrate binding protein [Candidatus Muiribacteriota bacterium]